MGTSLAEVPGSVPTVTDGDVGQLSRLCSAGSRSSPPVGVSMGSYGKASRFEAEAGHAAHLPVVRARQAATPQARWYGA